MQAVMKLTKINESLEKKNSCYQQGLLKHTSFGNAVKGKQQETSTLQMLS